MKVFCKGNKDCVIQEEKEVVQKYFTRTQETEYKVLQYLFLEAPSFSF